MVYYFDLHGLHFHNIGCISFILFLFKLLIIILYIAFICIQMSKNTLCFLHHKSS